MIDIKYNDSEVNLIIDSERYVLKTSELDNFLQERFIEGYEVKKLKVNVLRGRYLNTHLILDRPQKRVKKSYPYWLRKKM